MGTILSLAFCLAIVSPISTVGIATAIYMSGVATEELPISAGFGISGLVGPLAALNAEGARTRAFRKLHS
ncbi:putative secreted protein [Corynebacterium diphtheriae PW8]|nr:putative secreted protein [Corynebacterium diphtheriae PW8]